MNNYKNEYGQYEIALLTYIFTQKAKIFFVICHILHLRKLDLLAKFDVLLDKCIFVELKYLAGKLVKLVISNFSATSQLY